MKISKGKKIRQTISSESHAAVEYFTILIIFIIAIYNILHIIRLVTVRGLPLVDFEARWKENAYLFKGINPYTVTEDNADPRIGMIGDNMITAPWVWLIGTIFNPGILPYSIASIYGIVATLLVLVCACVCAYKYFAHERKYTKIESITIALTIITSLYWWYALYCGNNGAIAACLVIIGMCIYERHPILSGVIFCFAMIKPQLTAPFLLIIFIKRHYKTFFVTAGFGALSMLIVSIILKTAPWDLILQTTGKSDVLSDTYIGVFDLLRYRGMTLQDTLILDITGGVVFTLCMLWILKRKKNSDTVLLFSIAAVMQSMWFYKQTHDNIVMCILQMACVMLVFDGKRLLDKVIGMIGVILIVSTFYISNVVTRLIRASSEIVIQQSLYRTIEIFVYVVILVTIIVNRDKKTVSYE